MGAKRVLVVEDDASIRDLLTVVLADEGLEVHQAADGHEGLRLARATDPAVVVLDAMMPGLGGAEVIARLRRPDGTLPFAVLVLTAAPDLADRLRAQLGHDAVMDKPFDITALAATVRHLAGTDASAEIHRRAAPSPRSAATRDGTAPAGPPGPASEGPRRW